MYSRENSAVFVLQYKAHTFHSDFGMRQISRTNRNQFFFACISGAFTSVKTVMHAHLKIFGCKEGKFDHSMSRWNHGNSLQFSGQNITHLREDMILRWQDGTIWWFPNNSVSPSHHPFEYIHICIYIYMYIHHKPSSYGVAP